MAITTKQLSRGAVSQDTTHSSDPSHVLDTSVQGSYPVNAEVSGGLAPGATLTGSIRAKVASTDVVVEASASHPCTVTVADSPDAVTFTDRASFPVVGGRVRTGYRFTITSGTHYRVRATAPAGADGGVSKVEVWSQQRP